MFMNIKTSLIFPLVFLSDTSGDIQITQRLTSITKKKGNMASLECQIKTDMLKKSAYIHRYRQKPEQPLNRILYISSNENVVHEQGISEERYEARKWPSDSLVSLKDTPSSRGGCGAVLRHLLGYTVCKGAAATEQTPSPAITPVQTHTPPPFCLP